MGRKRFRDYVVVVTGASSGIGMATARAFALEGARVALLARREDRIQDLARRISAYNPEVLPVVVDVRDEAQVRSATDRVLARFGRIEILVNNAGVLAAGPVVATPAADMTDMFETNVFGLLAVSRAVVPTMQDRGYGHLVNVSSVAGYLAVPPLGVYAATKHAVQALSDAMRAELRRDGIHVTTVCPGPVATELGQRGRAATRPPRSTRLRVHPNGVAAAILDAVYAREDEVFVPGILRFAPLIEGLAPGISSSMGQAVRRLAHRAVSP